MHPRIPPQGFFTFRGYVLATAWARQLLLQQGSTPSHMGKGRHVGIVVVNAPPSASFMCLIIHARGHATTPPQMWDAPLML